MYVGQSVARAVCLASLLILVQACTPAISSAPTGEPSPSVQPAPTGQPTEDGSVLAATPTAPAPTATPGVVTSKDVAYATSALDGVAQDRIWALDVYAPPERADWPVILLMHGLGGSKDGYSRESEAMAEMGAIVYTITWPVTPADAAALDDGKGFRQIYDTVICALSYVRATAGDFGGDPDRTVLVAHSYASLYGAWIALSFDGLDAQWQEFAADRNSSPSRVECEQQAEPASIVAFVGIGGRTYGFAEVLQQRDRDLWEVVSPYAHFGQNLEMPLRLLHGEQDPRVDPEFSRTFHQALLDAGYDSQLILFEGGHVVPPELTLATVMELTGD